MDRPLRRGLDDPKADVPIRPLARNGEVDPKRSLVSLPLQYVAWLMIPARGRAGIAAPIGNHTFRATEIAAYISNGGAREPAHDEALQLNQGAPDPRQG